MLISLVGGLLAFSVISSLSLRQALCSWVLGLPQWWYSTPSCRFEPCGYFFYPSLRCRGFGFVPFNSVSLLFHRRYKGKWSVLCPSALAAPGLSHNWPIFRTLDLLCELLVLCRKAHDECKFSVGLHPPGSILFSSPQLACTNSLKN